MDKLYFIVGASGSGKDYIVNKICESGEYKKVISRTTRLPRKNEKNSHIFVSNEQADKEFENALFKTKFDNNRYYVLSEDLEGKDFYIIDPYGVVSAPVNVFLKYNVRVVYIKETWFKRACNMFKRGDKIKDIIRRLKNDKKEFKDFEYEADYVFSSNDVFYEWFIKEGYKND